MSLKTSEKTQKELEAQKLRAQALLHLEKQGQAVEKIPVSGVMNQRKDVGNGGDNTLDLLLKQTAIQNASIGTKSAEATMKHAIVLQQNILRTEAEKKDVVTSSGTSNSNIELASGWKEVPDVATNRSYYWNTTTNETTWERPTARPDVAILPVTAVASAAILPEGWVEKVHPATRQKYYAHLTTGKTSVAFPPADRNAQSTKITPHGASVGDQGSTSRTSNSAVHSSKRPRKDEIDPLDPAGTNSVCKSNGFFTF